MRELPVFPISVHVREGKAPTERSGINRKKQLRKGALGDGDMSGQIPVVQLFMWTPSRHVQARSFFKGCSFARGTSRCHSAFYLCDPSPVRVNIGVFAGSSLDAERTE